MEKEIIIEYKPNIDELVKVSKYLLFRLPFLIYIPILLIFLLLQSNIIPLSKSEEVKKFELIDLLPFIIIISIFIFVYFKTLSTMKKNILKNKRNLESQVITFNKHSYIQQGETFKIENFWKETFKIKETEKWFLIYLNKNSALPIIKSDLKDNQYNELKQLFNSIDVKKSLKS